MIDESAIRKYVAGTFAGTEVQIASQSNGAPEVAWGDTFFFYNPRGDIPAERKFPFATIVTKDYPGFDEASNLNRPGVFRLNIGVRRETFQRLFGTGDFESNPVELDALFPHPTYWKMHWLSVNNPSPATFETLKPLLDDAFQLAVARL